MKLEIECCKCGKVATVDSWNIIKAVMDSAEHGNIWGGCFCAKCEEIICNGEK